MQRDIIHIIIIVTQCSCFPLRKRRHVQIRTSTGNKLNSRVNQFHSFCSFLGKPTIFMHSLMSNLPVTIHFISKTPYFYIMRIFYTMFNTQITIFGSSRMVTVFQKIACICHTSCTKVYCHHHICISFFEPF